MAGESGDSKQSGLDSQEHKQEASPYSEAVHRARTYQVNHNIWRGHRPEADGDGLRSLGE
jgi:hypothetical protein